MISLHTAPARLRLAIIEYLFALFFMLRLITQADVSGVALAKRDEYLAMPEFTAADLLRITAPVRMEDIWTNSFLQREKVLPHARRAATITLWQVKFLRPTKTRVCKQCRKKTCACNCP